MRLSEGGIVERYRIQGLVGQGGMAEVYRARHTQLGTSHALKVLTITSPSVRRRMLLEGKLQAELRHPNIVSVNDILDLDGVPVLVMEFVDGPSLDELLDLGRLTYAQADTLARAIIAGVAHAHQRRLVHRDLKPANVMIEVTEHGFVPKVTDFGLAKVLDAGGSSSRTRTGATMGTPYYMSPEQIRDSKKLDHRTDIFAIGAMLYEMLAGVRPFERDDILATYTAIAAGDYLPIDELLPDCPPAFARAVHAALIPDADARVSTCEALLALWTDGSPPPVGQFTSVEIEIARAFQRSRSTLGEHTWVGPESLPDAVRPPARPPELDLLATEGISRVDGGPGVDTVVREAPAVSPNRAPWLLGAAGVVVLALLCGGGGVGLALSLGKTAPTAPTTPAAAPAIAAPVPVPAEAPVEAARVAPIEAPKPPPKAMIAPKPKAEPPRPANPVPEPRTADRPWAGMWSGTLGGRPAEIILTGPADAVSGRVVVKLMGNRLENMVKGSYDPGARALVLDDVADTDDAGRYSVILSDDLNTLSGQFSARHRTQIVPMKAKHQ